MDIPSEQYEGVIFLDSAWTCTDIAFASDFLDPQPLIFCCALHLPGHCYQFIHYSALALYIHKLLIKFYLYLFAVV